MEGTSHIDIGRITLVPTDPGSHSTTQPTLTQSRHFHLNPHSHPRQPYIPDPLPPDEEGEPWCDCCTAHLTQDDTTQQGLRDPADIRYRLHLTSDPTPTHSYQHLDYIRIARSNARYQDDQRTTRDNSLARTGNHPTAQQNSTYANTNDFTFLTTTLSHLQFNRYRDRGGRLTYDQDELRRRDHRYNSPNVHNMAAGQRYRNWFLQTISRRHYSLSEAT